MKKRIILLSILFNIFFGIRLYSNEIAFNFNNQTFTKLNTVIVDGYVTDCNSGEGISNVLVEADYLLYHFETETNSNGYYSIEVEAGTYTFKFTLLGYQDNELDNIVVTEGVPLTQNVEICENVNPVSNVYADPDLNCPGVEVSWDMPAGPYTIIYDDNSAEDYSIWAQPGGMVAVKFSPNSYPATITGGKINVGDGSFPSNGNFLGTTMTIGLLDDNGPNGLPGSILDSLSVYVGNYNWIHFQNVFETEISEGDFYIFYKQKLNSTNSAPIAIDNDLPIVYKSYVRPLNGNWNLSPLQDFMIRAELYGPINQSSVSASLHRFMSPPPLSRNDNIFFSTTYKHTNNGFEKSGTIIPLNNEQRSLSKYNLYLISGFDPDNGEGPEEGIPTSVGYSTTLGKHDNTDKYPGFYAYAVEAEYNNGNKSVWAYSNIFSCGLDNIVDFTISLCNNGSGDSTEIEMTGSNFPYQNLTLETDSNGLVVFDSIINGIYNITFRKIGYQKREIEGVQIDSDSSLQIELYENLFPARNLFVDTLTSKATWQPALIEALPLEDFEDSEFPPEGWESYTFSPDVADPWIRYTGFSYGDWPIPPQKENGTTTWFALSIIEEMCHHDGSTDFLITPNVDLRASENFILSFDSYCDFRPYSYQELEINYTNDNGLNWNLLDLLWYQNAQNWEKVELDLSDLSGPENNNDSIRFLFKNTQSTNNIILWTIDNVSIHNGSAETQAYYVYLNDGFVGQTSPDTTSYIFSDLLYGTEYTAKVRAVYSCGVSEAISYTWISTYLYPPRNFSSDYIYNTDVVPLKWNPPLGRSINNKIKNTNDTTYYIPEGIIGFNIYRNEELLTAVPYDSQEADEFITYYDNNILPGLYNYKVNCVYDLTSYGFGGEIAESMSSDIDTVEVIWGQQLPFYEGWESGNFSSQNWNISSTNWFINANIGNESPSAEFNWEPLLDTVYSEYITSTPINADSMLVGSFYLDFDVKLDDRNSTGFEKLLVQIKDSKSDIWNSIDTLVNLGSFDFQHKHIPIEKWATNNVFQVRFVATGVNSFDIISWYIDNINIYRICDPPTDISSTYFWNSDDEYGITLCWDALDFPGPFTIYKHWDSGENYSGIGLDGGDIFTTAARWDANMLTELEGYSVTSILFFLIDDGFEEITIKIWEGENADTLIYEQDVQNAEVGEFTEVQLDNPVLVNTDAELWIGYTVNQNHGSFAAGVDQGPAVAGYGDKISLTDGYWDNLSDFGLSYNWNLWMKLEIVNSSPIKETFIQHIVKKNQSNKPKLLLGKPNAKPIKLTTKDRNIMGFNIYFKDGDSDDYELFDFVPYVFNQTSYCKDYHAEDEVQSDKCYSFQIRSVREIGSDRCESIPGLTPDGEDFTYACVTSIQNIPINFVEIFPNPSGNYMVIKTMDNIGELKIVNFIGQVVYETNGVESNKYIVDTSKFPSGMYIVNIKTSSREYSRKVLVAR